MSIGNYLKAPAKVTNKTVSRKANMANNNYSDCGHISCIGKRCRIIGLALASHICRDGMLAVSTRARQKPHTAMPHAIRTQPESAAVEACSLQTAEETNHLFHSKFCIFAANKPSLEYLLLIFYII
jgi:hypothetical protein